MREAFESNALWLGAISGAAVAMLSTAYVTVLAIGLFTLASPDQPIQQPWFALMEVLILATAPAMVMLAAALHSWSPPQRRPLVLVGVVFFSMCALVTCTLHFAILALNRNPAFAGEPWSSLVFAFRWPSIAYALDILAWDVFFPIGALFLATAVRSSGLAGRIRTILVVSAVLAFAGLLGIPMGNMQVRNIGIIGYAVLFPVGAALLAVMFHRAHHSAAQPIARSDPLRQSSLAATRMIDNDDFGG
jgi:hypothetical protein